MFAVFSNLRVVCCRGLTEHSCCAGLDNLCHLSLSGHQCLSSQGLMILANMTALTFLDLSGLLINELLVMFDSCEVLGTLCSGLMSVMFINKLLVFDSCEVLGTLCSGLMSVMFISKLPVVFDSCEVLGTLCSTLMSGLLSHKLLVVFDSFEVYGVFSKLDVSDLEPLNLCAMHFVLRLFAQPYTQSKKVFCGTMSKSIDSSVTKQETRVRKAPCAE